MRVFLFLFLLFFPREGPAAEKESVFRNPVEFIRKKLLEVRGGAGYLANENYRRHNSMSSKPTGTSRGFGPLYDLRFGPVNISNVYTQPGYTRGSGLRVGLLFNYTGDEYQHGALAKRKNTVFAGGFIGYSKLTLYSYYDILRQEAGAIYAARLAPTIFTWGSSELSLILEAQHMNRLYVNYYFGIRDFEGTKLIPAYRGKRSTNYSATLLYVFTVGKAKRLEFLLWGGEKRYGPGVYHSPTVGLRHQYRAGVGLLFKFM